MHRKNTYTLIVINLIVLLYVLYLIISHKHIEGYYLAVTAMVLDVLCAPLLFYYNFKKHTAAKKTLSIMLIGYTFSSFLGKKIPIVLAIGISITCIFLLAKQVKKTN